MDKILIVGFVLVMTIATFICYPIVARYNARRTVCMDNGYQDYRCYQLNDCVTNCYCMNYNGEAIDYWQVVNSKKVIEV